MQSGTAAYWQSGPRPGHATILTQHNRATLIVAHDVERVLADIDTTTAIAPFSVWDMACSLSCRTWPAYRWRGGSTAGPSHYRTPVKTSRARDYRNLDLGLRNFNRNQH